MVIRAAEQEMLRQGKRFFGRLHPIYGIQPDDDEAVIAAALRAGYRLLDTGELYDNEAIVGEGIRRLIKGNVQRGRRSTDDLNT